MDARRLFTPNVLLLDFNLDFKIFKLVSISLKLNTFYRAEK